MEQIDTVKIPVISRMRVKKRKSKRFYLLLFLIVIGSVALLIGYVKYNTIYQTDVASAHDGEQHLRNAVSLLTKLPSNPFDAQVVSNARSEATTALADFVRVEKSLHSLPGILTSVPVYGAKLNSSLHVLPIAVEASQALLICSDMLNLIISRFHNPIGTQAPGISMTDFKVIDQDFQRIKTTIDMIIDQFLHLQPSDMQLDPGLAKSSNTLQNNIPVLQRWLDDVGAFLSVAPTLLGIDTPAQYLVEVLDSTELRPGGGFIGNYGIATISGARLVAAHITDVYLLDEPFEVAGHSIPYPPAYTWFSQHLAPASWSLRDSNLEADFPTVAQYAERNYTREGGNVPVKGVIAITPALIQQALAITGPISVPEYHETVNGQNLIALIHYHQLGSDAGSSYIASPDGHSSQRKRFTELLAEHFFTRVHQLSSSALPRFIHLLISSMQSKDIQIYLNSSVAEHLLQSYHLDAAIQATTGDGLFVVDANISPNKANQFITNTLDDQVTIDEKGNAVHRTTLTYSWVTNGPIYGVALYRDYVRVYLPQGSVPQLQNGWQPYGVSEAFGHEVLAGILTLSYGQTHVVSFLWKVSHAVQQDAHGWHYQYLIQKQAGIRWMLHVHVTLPPCAVIRNLSRGVVSISKQATAFNQALNTDVSLSTNYTCA